MILKLTKIDLVDSRFKLWMTVIILIGLLSYLLFSYNTSLSVIFTTIESSSETTPLDIPGRPFRGNNAPQQAYKHLERFHGIPPSVARNRLHKLKEQAGLGPADDVAIGRTGDVYDAQTGDHLGTLTDTTLGEER